MSFRHLDQFATVRSPVTDLPPVVRVLGTVLLAVVAATLPLGAWPATALLGLVVLALALLARLPIGRLALRMAGPFAFVLIASLGLLVFVPGRPLAGVGPLAVTDEGLLRFASALSRSGVALGAAVVLVSTTTFPELLHAFRQLRLPGTVTMALGLAYRLLYLVLDEVERLQRAARSRNVGGGTARRRAVGVGIAAAVLARSLSRAERTHGAMRARGFRGDLPSLHAVAWHGHAIAWAAALAGLVVAAAVWARLPG